MSSVIPVPAALRMALLRQLQSSSFQNPLHQQFQTGHLNSGLPPNQDAVVQVQQMLLAILAPALQGMFDGSSFGFGGSFGSGEGLPIPPQVPGQPIGLPSPTPGNLPPLGNLPPVSPVGGYDGGPQNPTSPVVGPGNSPTPGINPTPGYGPTPSPGSGDSGVGEEIPVDLDYRDLDLEERRDLSGMSDRERAVLHLWGIQMTSNGSQDGGVLYNVLENPSGFTDAEVLLAQELVARDQQVFGGVTGKALDQEFFQLYENITGTDISGRYANAPVQFAEGAIDMEARLTGDNGLNGFENQVLQLWGHAPLFNQGRIDGNIVDFALQSSNALEVNLNRDDLMALREADLASDGILNGDSLENAFLDTLDNLYLGGPSATAERTINDAWDEAALRRDGVLPPPAPGYDAPPPPVGPVPPGHTPNMAGGRCPFLAG